MPLIFKGSGRSQRAAASTIISTLHEAKQELAAEMEANLKQLKSILQDTQRIAKEMEAVLREVNGDPAEPDLEEATSKPKQKQLDARVAADQAGWKPPAEATKQGPASARPEEQPEETAKSESEEQGSETQSSAGKWRPPGLRRSLSRWQAPTLKTGGSGSRTGAGEVPAWQPPGGH